MSDRVKNVLIGLFVVGAISVLISLVLFLKPTIGDGKKTLAVRFANITGINVGTRVTLAGKPIGEVIHIAELPKARSEADLHGRIYLYQLTLKIDSSVDVYSCDEIAIKTTGLMGEKSIAILPKLPDKASAPAILITDQIAYANSTDPLENTFHHIVKVANRIETAVGRIDQWFDANQEKVARAIQSFDGAMGQIDALLGLVDNENLIPAVRTSVGLLNNNLNLIHSSLNDEQLLHKCAQLAGNLEQTARTLNSDGAEILGHLNHISRDLAAGSGTIGRFLAADDFYMRLTSIMNKGETLMNDINHYGVLFQYNKQWQKSRTKKANLLKALDTPQEFRSYFEGEVDAMTTSLGRLTELMERAGSQEQAHIIQSDAFKKDFASLMRQVQSLNDSIKLYNENLVAISQE